LGADPTSAPCPSTGGSCLGTFPWRWCPLSTSRKASSPGTPTRTIRPSRGWWWAPLAHL